MQNNNSDNLSSNISYVFSSKYWFPIFTVLYILYIIPMYMICILTTCLILYMNVHCPDKLASYKSFILGYIDDIFVDYLGNGSFDPLPKSK